MTRGVQYWLLPPARLTAQCEQKKPQQVDSLCWFCVSVCLSVTTTTACLQPGGSDGGQELKEPLEQEVCSLDQKEKPFCSLSLMVWIDMNVTIKSSFGFFLIKKKKLPSFNFVCDADV